MSTIHLDIDGPLAVMQVANPAKLNALTQPMIAALDSHCTTIESEEAVQAVILTGEGDRAFCAGADIAAWSVLSSGAFARHWIRDGHRAFDRLARLAKPTIAAINGHAFGGGLELAAACDIRVIAPAATLALPETGVGIVPGWSGTQRIARLLSEPVLKEMVLFGRRISASRALELGFVAEIAQDVVPAAKAICEQMFAASPRANEVAKYMINAAVGEDRDAMIEALGGGLMASTEDKNEGVSAFHDKRKPQFSGK